MLDDLAAKIEEWSSCRQDLTRWEDEFLLVDKPDPAKLAEHKEMLERLIFFGQIFAFVTSRPDFPGMEMGEMVHATQWVFREKFQMFHHPMGKGDADNILQEAFPES
jgi:hypothetical protein